MWLVRHLETSKIICIPDGVGISNYQAYHLGTVLRLTLFTLLVFKLQFAVTILAAY